MMLQFFVFRVSKSAGNRQHPHAAPGHVFGRRPNRIDIQRAGFAVVQQQVMTPLQQLLK